MCIGDTQASIAQVFLRYRLCHAYFTWALGTQCAQLFGHCSTCGARREAEMLSKPLAAWGLIYIITIAKSMGKVKAKYRLLNPIQMTFGVVEFTAIV